MHQIAYTMLTKTNAILSQIKINVIEENKKKQTMMKNELANSYGPKKEYTDNDPNMRFVVAMERKKRTTTENITLFRTFESLFFCVLSWLQDLFFFILHGVCTPSCSDHQSSFIMNILLWLSICIFLFAIRIDSLNCENKPFLPICLHSIHYISFLCAITQTHFKNQFMESRFFDGERVNERDGQNRQFRGLYLRMHGLYLACIICSIVRGHWWFLVVHHI